MQLHERKVLICVYKEIINLIIILNWILQNSRVYNFR